MNRIVVMLLCLGLCSFATPVHGQISGAAVSLTCDPSTHTPEDPLGINNTTVFCTVSNPTAYVEVIRVEVDTNGLDPIEPWNTTVDAGQEETFELNVSGWSAEMIGSSMTIGITATVLELNNVPPPTLQPIPHRLFSIFSTITSSTDVKQQVQPMKFNLFN